MKQVIEVVNAVTRLLEAKRAAPSTANQIKPRLMTIAGLRLVSGGWKSSGSFPGEGHWG